MICAALLLPLCAGAEQIDASQFRRSFNVAFPGCAGTTMLTDLPVLVRLSLELNDFQCDKCADGGDLRISGVARSEAWLKATYDTIRDDSFAKYGRVKSNRHWALEIRIR